MATFDPRHFESWAAGLLEAVPRADRAAAASAMLGAVAAQLRDLVGRNEAAGVLYALADVTATGRAADGEVA